VSGMVSDVVAASPANEKRPGKAEKEYETFLLGTLGIISLVVGMLVCYLASLPMGLAEELALTNEEVTSIAEPASRLLAKSKIPGEVRETLVNSGDYVGLTVALTAYVVRVLDLMKGNIQHVATRQNQGVPTTNPASNASNGHTGSFDLSSVAGFGSFIAN
jgi:hypothetical protein